MAAMKMNSLSENHRHSNVFSTHLNGRFYENSGMEAHSKKKIAKRNEKKAKRKKEFEAMRKREEQRVRVLEEKLAQKERVRTGATLLQSHFHRRKANKRVEVSRGGDLLVLY